MTTAAAFHRTHPICDLLGINLTHPRFLLDHIDLGQRQDTSCRGDFVKLKEWGVAVVMCKGGPTQYDGNFAYLWKSQPERRTPRRVTCSPSTIRSNCRSPFLPASTALSA